MEEPKSVHTPKSKELSYFSVFNVQGLKPQTTESKVAFVKDLLHESNQLFICLTETWLKDHTDAELNISGYKLFRADRIREKKSKKGRYSGGSAVYIRNDIAETTEPVLNYSNGVVELLSIYSKRYNLLISVIYRQPDNTSGGHPSTSIHFIDALDRLKKVMETRMTDSPTIILCGDFNLPHISWPDGNPGQGANPDERIMIWSLKSFSQNFFLTQVITEPTHKDGNTLDLVLTNDTHMIHNTSCFDTLLSTSHHKIIEVTTLFNSPFHQSQIFDKCFHSKLDGLNFFSNKTDWKSIISNLESLDWDQELCNLDPDKMYDKILQICESICTKYTPKKTISLKPKMKKFSREKKILLRRQRKIKNQIKTCTAQRKLKFQTELIDIEKKLQKSYKTHQLENEQKATKAIKSNSKYFFNYAKRFSKIKSSIGPLLNDNGEYVLDDNQMAEMLSNQYKSIFTKPSAPLKKASVIFHHDAVNGTFTDFDFNMEDIKDAIEDLSLTSAAGPDGFPTILLKNCKNILSKPLFILWRKSLDLGITPHRLKQSHVVPIHKGGSNAIPANYRPVALTSHIIKLFEKIIRKRLVTFMENNNMFNPTQHGFRSGRSCLSQLLNHYDNVIKLLEEGYNVDVVYLDFSKAFDKLDFGILLEKIKNLGINGRLGRWLYSFLTNRYQSVVVHGSKSIPAEVLSGVPQGSVLGPLLFLIFIGDIDNSISHSFLSSFADDTRVGCGIKSNIDVLNLQNDLDHLYHWANRNNMEFNDVKFELLRYGKNNSLKEDSKYFSNNGEPIKEKSNVKDLGVTMSNSANFSIHINNVISKTNQLSAWILRTFKSRNQEIMLTLWKSLVIPHFDYCSQLYSPSRVSEIQQLEMVQRSFLRKIKGTKSLNYWEQLKKLKVSSLERRRERYQIIYIWKMLEGIVPNFEDSSKVLALENERRGRTCYTRVLRRSSVQLQRCSSLSVHGLKLFNCMPKKIRNMKNCSVEKFKSILDSFLSLIPDEPQILGYTAIRRADSNSILHMVKLVGQCDATCLDYLQVSSTAATRWKSEEDFGHDT